MDLGIIIGFITVSTGAGVIFAAFAGAYFFGKSRAEKESLTAAADPELLDRIARIERIVEATAFEIERISEGQRFTTKMLSETKSLSS